MTATLARACLDGNVSLVDQILESGAEQVDSRDESGLTPLQHAVKGNHVEIAARLLAKGASAAQVAEQDLVKGNPELSQLISSTLRHTQSAVFQAAPVVDSHGGKQMPDGSVSYVQPPTAQTSTEYGALAQQQTYVFQPQSNITSPTYIDQQQQSNAAKDPSSGTLPPPEVARLIPCRFFPNCRYADKCLFAHPVPLLNGSPSQAPVSPGQNHLYYQAPAYGYPVYGPPQHFYSMAPPMPLQYSHSGVPIPLHMPTPPQHMASSDSSSDAYTSQSQYMSNSTNYDESAQGTSAVDQSSALSATDGKQLPDKLDAEDKDSENTEDPSPAPPKQVNSYQQQQHQQQYQQHQQLQPTSFSAFMTHHAVPFQPGQLPFPSAPVGMDGAILSNSQAFPRVNKGPRRNGPSLNGSNNRTDHNGTSSKRSSERPACLFFARSACKHGEDCRFPHILPDGTDARGPNAGRSSSIEASRGINRALAAKNARNSSSLNDNEQQEHTQNVIPSTSQASAHTTIASVSETESVPQTSASLANAVEDDPAKDENSSILSSGPSAAVDSNSAPNGDDSVESSAGGVRASTREEARIGTAPNQSSERAPAPIPSKPVLNGQPSSQANGKPHAGNKSHVNGAAKGQAQNGARGTANGRSTSANPHRANGHSNGFQLPRKLNSQRLPQPDDFPALSNGAAVAAAAAAAPAATSAPKVNFSAILSAPAPPKKQQPDTKESVDRSHEDKLHSDDSVPAEKEVSKSSPSPKQSAPVPVPDFASIVAKPVVV